MPEMIYCAECGMPLDPEGCDEIGAIPPEWHDDTPYCGSTCWRIAASNVRLAETREIAGIPSEGPFPSPLKWAATWARRRAGDLHD